MSTPDTWAGSAGVLARLRLANLAPPQQSLATCPKIASVPRIRPLDVALVNKIAAGEVIERPASVVKELLENAIDAGATRLDVELAEGGTSLIRVTDDGGGIAAEDLPLAVAPHATSKITQVDDLFHISTLGFRGEALASIASISELRIVSRRPEDPGGHELIACDGRLEGPRPVAAPPGTTVEVRNLFFNVPARRKFLRAAPTELGHITEQIARIALAQPQVALRQVHNGRDVRRLPASADRRGRLADFYGAELAGDLFPVRSRERELTIEGLVAPPASARASGKWQYVFLNGRCIVDRNIMAVIREAFRGLIEPSRYPVAFLFLSCDPGLYDVNVHPTKIEVRWRDSGLVRSQVLAVLREALLSRDLTPTFHTRPTTPLDDEQAAGVRQAIADFLRSAPPAQRHLEFGYGRGAGAAPRPASGDLSAEPDEPISARFDLAQPHRALDRALGIGEPARDVHTQLSPPVPADTRTGRFAAPADNPAAPVSPTTEHEAPTSGLAGRALQVHNSYLVVESPDGIMIVDQHALHERILYEQLCRRILAGPLEAQRLLLPEPIEVSPQQSAAADAHAELLGRIGIELSAFGPTSLAVQTMPSFLHSVDIRAFVSDALDRLAEPGQQEHSETLLQRLLSMMACKAAVKAGDPLTAEEITALLAQRESVERSSNCPHGRPTTLRLTMRDLEREFKRG